MILIVALVFVQFLPLYITRTMTRSMLIGNAGDVIEWGWKLTSLNSFWENYTYLRPEEQPSLWLGINLVLAFAYAFVVALCLNALLKSYKSD